MSMWYDFDGVLILKYSLCPTFTLIDVAKPWIVGSPAPFTCQSLGGSPGKVFSQAITLTTGGPHGSAAAGRALARESMLISTASTEPMIKRRPIARRGESPATDILPPLGLMSHYGKFGPGFPEYRSSRRAFHLGGEFVLDLWDTLHCCPHARRRVPAGHCCIYMHEQNGPVPTGVSARGYRMMGGLGDHRP